MIVSGHLLYSDVIAVSGLLIVGDPHISSKKPGRRKDTNWPTAILRKLEACVAYANEHNLILIILGDLFDESLEEDEALKTQVSRILKAANIPAISNIGNHDMRDSLLSDSDTMALIAVNDALDVIKLSGPVCVFDINGRKLGLGMTPSGQDIPTNVEGVFQDVDAVLWVTHHDIAFDSPYPGAVLPFTIKGCSLVVNGHVHGTKKPVRAGETLWLNLGNITRQSTDMVDHRPCAWIIDGTQRIESFLLPHEIDVFDFTGKYVAPASAAEVAESVESAFVTLLAKQQSMDVAKSDDGSIIREEIEAKFDRENTNVVVRSIILSLLGEAVARKSAA